MREADAFDFCSLLVPISFDNSVSWDGHCEGVNFRKP